MSRFICPVCGGKLIEDNRVYLCNNNHSFDKAKSGYINLLLSNQTKVKNHGDNKQMVRARRDFLNKGYYNVLLNRVSEVIAQYIGQGDTILDAGCGEGWYTAHIYNYLIEHGIKPKMMGVDISKDALEIGAKRNQAIKLAVASVFNLPVQDDSCDLLLTFFAPICKEEFDRVLKEKGIIIKVIPLEKHLWGLKKAIYEHPYENELEGITLEGYELLERVEAKETIHLTSYEDIVNLFVMTPYCHKTSKEDQQKLEKLSTLDTEIEFGLLVYRKISKA